MTNAETPASTGGDTAAPNGPLGELPERVRVHALAKLLGSNSRDVLAKLTELGESVRSVQSSVPRAVAVKVAESFAAPAEQPAEPESAPQPEPAPEPEPAWQSARMPVFAAPSPVFLPPEPPPARPAPEPEPAPAEAEQSEPAKDEQSEAPERDKDEDGDDAAGRRRRRRGRRGRGRGKGGEDGAQAEDETTDETEESQPQEKADAEADDEDSDEGGSRRRRRRRRRKNADDDAAEAATGDDPPNTVVHVREGKNEDKGGDKNGKEAKSDKGDGVRSVRGSTRLEAKRQRRRDGREAGRRRTPILSEAEFLARRESVERTMVVAERGEHTQIGVLEDGVLVEHFVTAAGSGSIVGNVYLGRVQNVLPSMEAAFVDIGRGRNAVLYAGEVDWDAAGLEGKSRKIEQALSTGDNVLVQVTKDPVGHKGARLTTQISLPGRFLVYVPAGGATGISRKLPENERRRLKDILKRIVPEDAGVIIRTASEGISEDELERDVRRLKAQWEVIKEKADSASGGKKSAAPTMLYEEPDLLVKVVRDLFTEDFAKLEVQGGTAWDTINDYVGHVAPDLAGRLKRYVGTGDVFTDYRIDEQITKALDRKVWLPSGGYLVIDRTEAMTVIDVNTGKFTGSGGNLEETVTRNNLESAEEIVRQLRLRDIGGIIVIDFIDMVLESNRELVLRRLTECLGRDRTRHQVAEVTSLGLVQMTRKKVGTGLIEAFSTPCEHCKGRGVIVSTELPRSSNGSGGGNGGQQSGGSRRSRGRKEEPQDTARAPERRESVVSAVQAIATATKIASGKPEGDPEAAPAVEDTTEAAVAGTAVAEPETSELDTRAAEPPAPEPEPEPLAAESLASEPETRVAESPAEAPELGAHVAESPAPPAAETPAAPAAGAETAARWAATVGLQQQAPPEAEPETPATPADSTPETPAEPAPEPTQAAVTAPEPTWATAEAQTDVAPERTVAATEGPAETAPEPTEAQADTAPEPTGAAAEAQAATTPESADAPLEPRATAPEPTEAPRAEPRATAPEPTEAPRAEPRATAPESAEAAPEAHATAPEPAETAPDARASAPESAEPGAIAPEPVAEPAPNPWRTRAASRPAGPPTVHTASEPATEATVTRSAPQRAETAEPAVAVPEVREVQRRPRRAASRPAGPPVHASDQS